MRIMWVWHIGGENQMKKTLSVVTACLLAISLPLSTFAHGGRTDGSGGHKDNKNKSGLGGYHYHCGGYPAHLHKGGVCPYKGGGSTSSKTASVPKTVYASSITATNIPTKINAGDTATLKASVYPSNAEDKEVTWESSDTSVLSVSKTGELTAVGVGTAIITAKTSRGTSKKFTITVNEVVAESISIADNKKEILIENTETLKCKFTPENTTDKTVEWKSDDENIISITADGKIIGKAIGRTKITAVHKDYTDSITIEVKPIEADKVEILLPDDIEMEDDIKPRIKKGTSIQLNSLIEPENTTYKEIEWSVSEEGLATIDKNGVLTAHATGTVIVTATTKCGLTDEIEIEIFSNLWAGVAGVGGTAAVVSAGTALYLKKKKEKQEITEIE